jgi:hypothetical protein
MSFTRWLRSFGTTPSVIALSPRYRPKLESLDDRLAPSAGPGWSNFLAVTAHWGQPVSPAPNDSTDVATQFAVFVTRDATVGSQANVVVVALDADGRPVKNYTGTVALTSTDSAATLPADYTFTAADHGRHTFTVTFGTSGSQTVTATDKADSTITGSSTVMVDPAAVATHFYVSIERNTYAGSPARVIVAALDADNNLVRNFTGTVHFTSTGVGATLPADYTFTAADRGAKVFTVTPSAAGSLTLTATDTADSTITGSATVTVNAAQVATHFALLVRPAVSSTDSTLVLVVALDANNRPVAGYTGTVHFTSSDTAAGLPADYMFTAADRGVKAFTVSFATAGKQTLTVTDMSSSSLTGTATVNVRNSKGHGGGFFGGDKFQWWE